VFALLGELYGSGCPIGYLLIQSVENDPGGKEHLITDLLAHLRDKCGIRPIITLSDKDFSEINAFLQVFPWAKHQLCFWHCLRAVKTRLSILRRQPKHYDALEAKKEFDWIDKDFTQSQHPQNVSYPPAISKRTASMSFSRFQLPPKNSSHS
jgi:hypothetical protein